MIATIKKYFNLYGWFMWALIVAFMVLLFWLAFLSDNYLSHFFSSDALYLPALYRDFFQDGYTLNGWTLNQAPNFFPDMLLFFLLNGVFGDFITATFAYSIMQYFAVIVVLYLIFKQVKPNSHPSTFAPAILLFSSFLFLLFIDQNWWLSSLLNHNSYHDSAFIMSLLCVYLFCKYLNKKSQKTLISVLVLSVLSGACDKLFFICFTIPIALAVVVLYFFNKEWKVSVKILVTLAIGVIIAVTLWIFFKNNPYFSLTRPYGNITANYIQNSWSTFSKQMYGYLTTFSFIMILTYLSLLSYLAVGVHIFIKSYKLINEKKRADAFFAFELYVLFFTPIVLLAPILSGSYDDVTSLRYSYFPYILLPFNLVVLVSNWLSKNKLFKIILNTTLSFSIVGYLLIHFPVQEFGKGMSRFFNFYPEKARIVDDYFSENETLKYGITNEYWMARQVTMFSKKGVRLYHAHPGGDPWLHVVNKHWFTDNNKGKHAHCEFTFLLWSKTEEIPVFFQTTNPDIQPTDLDRWNLYHVAPYRFIIPGVRFKIDPILIDSSDNQIYK